MQLERQQTMRMHHAWLVFFGRAPLFFLYNSQAIGEQQTAALKQLVNNLQAASSGLIPRGSKDDLEIWAPELAGNVESVFIPAIANYDRAIARAVLMPGLLGLTPDEGVGSQARSKVHLDVLS